MYCHELYGDVSLSPNHKVPGCCGRDQESSGRVTERVLSLAKFGWKVVFVGLVLQWHVDRYDMTMR